MTPISVLIIEDEPYIRDSLAEFLVDEGFMVEIAESGEEALDCYRKRRFHLCIVDIRLSGMDGTRAIQKIKDLDPQTRILVFTGSLEFQINADLARLGLTEENVVYKPVSDLDVILRKIEGLGFRLPNPVS